MLLSNLVADYCDECHAKVLGCDCPYGLHHHWSIVPPNGILCCCFEKYGVLEYLHDFYDVLHTQSHEWLLVDIDEFIGIRQKEEVNSYYKPCSSNHGIINDKELPNIMIGEINQENLYLLLPSKVCWLAPWLAEDEGISLIEAVKRVYSSAMYKQLEIESTKMWHLGPVDLYRELRDKN